MDAETLAKFPSVAAAYYFKDSDGNDLLNMEDNGRIFAQTRLEVKGAVSMNVAYRHREEDVKYAACYGDFVFPQNTSEAEILARWQSAVRDSEPAK
jgi:hypothetical protein